MNTLIKTGIAACLGLCTIAAFADEPVQNINPARHGNLAAAQNYSRQAFDRLTAAQQANEFDLGGHAAKAKELLREANVEMKLAAESANQR